MKSNQPKQNSEPDRKKNPAALIYTLRNDYRSRSLDRKTARRDPFEQFELWLAEALAETADGANAMTLATATAGGRPASRVVLLRGFDRKGFVFYTNYRSRKAAEIAENPQASLLFFWAGQERQVRVDGLVVKTSRRVSEAYFATRPRESQIGAWASAQSEAIENRRALEAKIDALEREYAGREVPCPDFWGGYLVKPDAFEFWQGGAGRLHDRLHYTKSKTGWEIARLAP
jgi:pyridoxamine-phosphate oxidase